MTENQIQGKEIRLHPKELKQMLEGSLSWADVATCITYKQEKISEKKVSTREPVLSNSETSIYTNINISFPKFEGIKVVFFLGGTLLLTMVTWVYFVFYCQG